MINMWIVGVTVDNRESRDPGDDPRQEETGVARVSALGGRAALPGFAGRRGQRTSQIPPCPTADSVTARLDPHRSENPIT
jgi:hypothetical protein